MAEQESVALSPEEIEAVINYWRNRAVQLENRVITLEIALQRAVKDAESVKATDETETE